MNRITHNNILAFAGPCPATGYHWINGAGVRADFDSDPITNGYYNMVFPILRMQSLSYNINTTRPNATYLGSNSIIVDEVTDTSVDISFNYLQHGIINELRLGLYANYYESGSTVYGHFERPALSGFLSRSFDNTNIAGTQIANSSQANHPYDCRDYRNLFFLVHSEDGVDLVEDYAQESSKTTNKRVYGFGNAYLTSYSSQASVGSFPECSVTYTADNVEVYNSPAYQILPSTDPTTGNQSSLHFSLPSFSESDVQYEYVNTVIRPSDISLRIAEVNQLYANKKALYGTGILPSNYSTAMASAISTLKVQGYNLNVGLNRTPLNAYGKKRSLDKVIEAPIEIDLSIDVLDDQHVFDYVKERMTNNKDFYVSITLNNPTGDYVDVQYDILRCKCVGISTSTQVSSNSTISYNFRGDISTSDLTKGFFISGNKNIYKRELEF